VLGSTRKTHSIMIITLSRSADLPLADGQEPKELEGKHDD
jgi:hypothetical protein